MSLVGCWLKHFAKWNHPRFSVQEWLPSWILTPVMWKRPMCWEMDGLKASWWSHFVHLSAAGDVWHLGDVKRAVRWLPSLCPHNVGNGFGALPSHCMWGIWRQRGEMAAHGRHQNDMWDYRFSGLKSPCSASNWLSYQSLGEDQRETLMLRVCNQNSRCERGIETSYNPGLPDPCSPPSQWRKAEELKDPRKSHTSLPCLT